MPMKAKKGNIMKLTNKFNTIATYEIGHGFYADIMKDGELYSAWLFHKSYGIKDLMFGMKCSLDEFLELVESDTQSIEIYISSREEENGVPWGTYGEEKW